MLDPSYISPPPQTYTLTDSFRITQKLFKITFKKKILKYNFHKALKIFFFQIEPLIKNRKIKTQKLHFQVSIE